MSQGELPAYQRRSRAARQKIVSALDAVLKEKPFDQVSVAEIAERADVAVGTVYQRFKNKDALIPVILEIYKSRIEEWMSGPGRIEIEPDDDLRSGLRKTFRQVWTIFRNEAHLLRAVHLHARLKTDLDDDDDWARYEKASAMGIRMIIDHFSSDIARDKLDRAAAFATYFFNAIMIEKGLYPDEPPAMFFKPKGNVFADQCADMLYGYLTTPD